MTILILIMSSVLLIGTNVVFFQKHDDKKDINEMKKFLSGKGRIPTS